MTEQNGFDSYENSSAGEMPEAVTDIATAPELESETSEPITKSRRQQRKDEKAARKEEQPRRVGTLTMGVALVASGVTILAYMIKPDLDVTWITWLAPVILIMLGLEIIVRYTLHKHTNFRYDVFSGFICLVVVFVCLIISGLHGWLPYVSPARYEAQHVLSLQMEDDIYSALDGVGGVAEVYVSVDVEPKMMATGRSLEDYSIGYSRVTVTLAGETATEDEFAAACRKVLDRLQSANIELRASHFNGDGPNCSYDLYLNSKFQMGLSSEELALQVGMIKYEPDPADGWMPGGYEEMVEQYGQETADEWLEVMIEQQNNYLHGEDETDYVEPDSGEDPEGHEDEVSGEVSALG